LEDVKARLQELTILHRSESFLVFDWKTAFVVAELHEGSMVLALSEGEATVSKMAEPLRPGLSKSQDRFHLV
jgi:hypothetical protein